MSRLVEAAIRSTRQAECKSLREVVEHLAAHPHLLIEAETEARVVLVEVESCTSCGNKLERHRQPNAPRPRMLDADVRRCLALRDQGISWRAIAAQTGFDQSTIRYRIKAAQA